MVIAALVSFGILLIAWIVAPEGRARGSVSKPPAREVVAPAAEPAWEV